jgi:hypothetical protein
MTDLPMQPDLASLADLPELASDQEPPTSEIPLFKTGRYRHAKFGTWDISRQTFDGFLHNFAKKGRVPVDLEHGPERGGSSEAAGWITALKVVGNTLRATIQWTKLGADAIRERRFLYISPTWSFDGRDEHGASVGPKLIGAGLTNRPHFESFPALNLSAAAADRFDGMWIEQEVAPNELQLAREWVAAGAEPQLLEDLSPGFAEHMQLAIEHGIEPRFAFVHSGLWKRNRHLHGSRNDELKIIELGRACQKKWWKPIAATLDRHPGQAGAAGTAA